MAQYIRYQYAPLADEMPEAQAVMGNAASAIHDQQQRATAQFKASLKALATATPFATCPPSSPYPDGEVHNSSSSSVGNSSRSGDSFGTGSGRSNKGEISCGRSDALSRSGGDDGALGEIELSPAGGEGVLHAPARALTFPRTHGLSVVRCWVEQPRRRRQQHRRGEPNDSLIISSSLLLAWTYSWLLISVNCAFCGVLPYSFCVTHVVIKSQKSTD